MNRTTVIVLFAFGVLAIVAMAVLSNSSSPIANTPTITVPQTTSSTETGERSSLPIYNVTLPEFAGITRWWNTPENKPLTPAGLRGSVVLVDFWTYSCINCIRTYPFLRSMQEKYAKNGLVIIGVHTPEFEFEKNAENVDREITKNNLAYPVALDPNYVTWNLFGNHSWPASYLFDKQGRLRRAHIGEGDYEEQEAAIRSLLEEQGIKLADMPPTDMRTPDFQKIKTPETYFGLLRGDAFVETPGPKNIDATFQMSESLPANQWSVDGVWKFSDEYVQADSASARFRFRVHAQKLHLVLESANGEDKHADVYIDGVKTSDITVNASTLYDIATFPDADEHTVEIRVIDPGIRFFAATFS